MQQLMGVAQQLTSWLSHLVPPPPSQHSCSPQLDLPRVSRPAAHHLSHWDLSPWSVSHSCSPVRPTQWTPSSTHLSVQWGCSQCFGKSASPVPPHHITVDQCNHCSSCSWFSVRLFSFLPVFYFQPDSLSN